MNGWSTSRFRRPLLRNPFREMIALSHLEMSRDKDNIMKRYRTRISIFRIDPLQTISVIMTVYVIPFLSRRLTRLPLRLDILHYRKTYHNRLTPFYLSCLRVQSHVFLKTGRHLTRQTDSPHKDIRGQTQYSHFDLMRYLQYV